MKNTNWNDPDFQGFGRQPRPKKERKAVGTPLGRTLLNIAVTLVFAAVYFYIVLPPISLKSEDFYVFVLLVCAVYGGCAILTSGFQGTGAKGYFTFLKKQCTVPLIAAAALIATALVCLHNNELHMLCQLDSGWVHVPHMYENLVRADLTYRGGIGIFRYVLPWAGTFLLCVLAGTYSLQQFLSLCRKAFAALRRRCLLRRVQARQALPCFLLVLSMADRAQFAAELADRLDHAHVVRTGGAQLRSRCATPSGTLDDAAGSLCGNADLLVVEDLEAFVCGTEQWQRVCAFFFQSIIEDGTDVIAAADDPAKTAPEFWYRMTCACPFSVRTLKE